MTESESAAPEAPDGVDTEKPSAARMYDWYLGGQQNWAVDRELGRRIDKLWPQMKPVARQNRAFLRRVVSAALDAGIRQFLDLGSGVPTVGNVHEIVERQLPEGERATVVYVDYEPVATAHATLILERAEATDWAGIIQQDMRRPNMIFEDETTQRLIDFDQPVCLLMIAVLHFVGEDDRPDDLMAAYRERLAPGSWLALTHGTLEGAPEEGAAAGRRAVEAYKDTSNPIWMRTRAEVAPWFGDWTLLEPGLARTTDWRPDGELDETEAAARPYQWCGVAEKPESPAR